MIDESFIITYTNALYSTPEDVRPSYNEFRDMFSSGQIKSKNWAIKRLLNVEPDVKSAVVVGAWYGTLGLMLHRAFPSINVTLLDIDSRCKAFTDSAFYQIPEIKSVSADMYNYTYTEELVVNTSCEHIPDLSNWLSLVPDGTLVLLQSNNNSNFQGHINCSESVEDFVSKANLSNVIYSGQLEMPMYTRYMIIGIK